MNSKIDFFQNRITQLQEKITQLKARSRDISVLRIIAFLLFVAAIIFLLNLKVFTPIIVISFLFFTGFGLIVRHHNKLRAELLLHEKIRQINQEEIDRLNYKFEALPTWEEFDNEQHVYAGDLDLYGKKSLFQLINRAETATGVRRLKYWVEHFADKATIETRQAAVKELASKVAWRQKIQAHGNVNKRVKGQDDDFQNWLNGTDKISSNRLYRVLPYIFFIVSGVLLIGAFTNLSPFSLMLLPIIISGFFLVRIRVYSETTYQMTSTGVVLLQSVENILLLLEKENFENGYLLELKKKLFDGRGHASWKIIELRKILAWLNLRGNQIYHLFNFIFLLDFIFLMKAEKWRKKYKDDVGIWFGTIADFEALSSLAAFTFAHDGYTFPGISGEDHIFTCTSLGHPLIPPEQRISNDFAIEGAGQVGIVTGSNMAGKSTFLRTVGVNAVLAFAGAPVCADQLDLSIFQVFTSMRTKDNLVENISSFYAELLRLKSLLQSINDTRPLLFLLDEILKGTNSTDRHLGAESLAIQLSQSNAFGLISTHDLQLGELKLDARKLKNYNFSSEIDGEEIVFDYKLREGICMSTNASQLMSKIGINIHLSI
jgi:Flp pilus assembly protein TadB